MLLRQRRQTQKNGKGKFSSMFAQVRALEDWIGAPLFERRTQGVELTALGRSVFEDFEAAFDAPQIVVLRGDELFDALEGLEVSL